MGDEIAIYCLIYLRAVPYGTVFTLSEETGGDASVFTPSIVSVLTADDGTQTTSTPENGAEYRVTGDLEITYTNTRKENHVKIVKAGDNTEGASIEGATFTLSDTDYGTLTSDADGSVTAADETEIFSLDVGNTYTLTETAAPQYFNALNGSISISSTANGITVTPGEADAANVSTNLDTEGVYVITITNIRKTATVTLTKNVEGLDSDKNTEFEFTITGIGNENITENLVGNTESENHSKPYSEVPYGASITITESQNSDFDASYTVNGGEAVEGNSAIFTVSDDTVTDGVVAVTFTNARNNHTLQVLKVDEGTKPLANAIFSLYTKEEYDKGSSGTPAQTGLTSDGQGKIQIGTIATGTYYLVETTAPSGYNLLDKPVIITIESGRVSATLGSDSTAQNAAELITPESGEPYWLITVHNNSGLELPHTGGPGTLLYTLSGIALMLGATLMYGFRMRRRERRLN